MWTICFLHFVSQLVTIIMLVWHFPMNIYYKMMVLRFCNFDLQLHNWENSELYITKKIESLPEMFITSLRSLSGMDAILLHNPPNFGSFQMDIRVIKNRLLITSTMSKQEWQTQIWGNINFVFSMMGLLISIHWFCSIL